MSPRCINWLTAALAVWPAAAFPSGMTPVEVRANLAERQSVPSLPPNIGESNTGVVKSTIFNVEDQYVNVQPGSGHEFVAPSTGDIRGPCPGLNAVANHGFFPHNGVVTIAQTVTGLGQAYNMGPDLAAALAVVAVALTGDYLTESWSIGGPFPASLPGLLSNPGGISFSHNKYENDASVGRGDAYLHNGDAYSLQIENFDQLYNLADNYTLAVLREHANNGRTYSVENNPYYFSAPFSGLVSTAAHEFVINFMSNHSAEVPSGYLDRDTLKSFFSVTGPDNAHVWTPGYERIPNNWYRRPSSNQYDAVRNNADNVISLTTYPQLAQFGGNTGKVNSFVGVDAADLSGGVYNSENLFQGNNLGCFIFQFTEAVIPDELAGKVADITPILDMVSKYLGPAYAKLQCPLLAKFNQGLFNQFPGYHYNPTQTNPGGM